MEAGEVAFLKHTTVNEMIASRSFKGVSADQFQLLCKNGQRMPISDYLQCNWGLVPSNAIVTSSARTQKERKQYQKFLEMAIKLYSHKTSSNFSSTFNSNPNGNFNDRFNNRFQPDRVDRFSNPNDRFNSQNRDPNDRFSRQRNSNSRDPFDVSSTTETALNDTQLIENFELFDSSRYGGRLNLMFQVRFQRQEYHF